MANNVEHDVVQIIDVTEFRKIDAHRIKHRYIAPTLTRLNETNIAGGSSAEVNENSNGGAFTNAS